MLVQQHWRHVGYANTGMAGAAAAAGAIVAPAAARHRVSAPGTTRLKGPGSSPSMVAVVSTRERSGERWSAFSMCRRHPPPAAARVLPPHRCLSPLSPHQRCFPHAPLSNTQTGGQAWQSARPLACASLRHLHTRTQHEPPSSLVAGCRCHAWGYGT